jgi:hypothetical protein
LGPEFVVIEVAREALPRRVIDILDIDENGDGFHEVSQTKKVGNRREHYPDTDQQRYVGHEIGEDHQRDSAKQRNRSALLSAIDEISEPDRAEQHSPKQHGRHRTSITAAAALLIAAFPLVSGRASTPAAPHLRKIDTLIFAFAHLTEGRVLLDGAGKEHLLELTALKAIHPALRVAISVGGWGAGGFSEAASTAAGRGAFADSAAQLVAMSDADGLDVDWEYPGHDESGIRASANDRTNFTLLLRATRAKLDEVGIAHGRSGADHYTLSIAVADARFVSGIDIAGVAPDLDWFNLMTYDFVNCQTPFTGHHTGLHGYFAGACPDAGSIPLE